MMVTCSKKLVSPSLYTSDVWGNVFLPWWNSNVYKEPLNRWEIFKELSTDSMSMKCILLQRSITYQFFNIFWKHRSPRNGVMDRTMSFSPWTINPVGQLKWTTLAISPTLRCFFVSFSSVTTNTTKFRRLF